MQFLKDEILKSTRWLNLIKRYYKDKNGKEQNWVLAQRNNSVSAVMIIPYHYTTAPEEPQVRLAVIKEYRVPIKDFEWGFPAGLIDKGEDAITTAARELTEETGLVVDEVLEVSPDVYNTAGMTDESITMVYVNCSGTISKEGQEEAEDIETFLMTPSEVEELMKSDVKFGAKAWLVMREFVRKYQNPLSALTTDEINKMALKDKD